MGKSKLSTKNENESYMPVRSSFLRNGHESRKNRLLSKFGVGGPRFRKHVTFPDKETDLIHVNDTWAAHEYDRTSVRTHLNNFADFKRCVVDVIIYKKEEMNETLDPEWYEISRGIRQLDEETRRRKALLYAVGGEKKLNILAATTPRDDIDIERIMDLLVAPGENLRAHRVRHVRDSPLAKIFVYQGTPHDFETALVRVTDSVRFALNEMREHNVKSLPVRDEANKIWVGMVDCRGLMNFISTISNDNDFNSPLLGNVKIWDWDIVTTDANEHLEAVVHHMVFNSCYSLMAVSGEKVVGYITQQSVTALMDEHLDALFDDSDETLETLGFVNHNIASVLNTCTVREAMIVLKDFHYQSLAVVDQNEKIVSEFSSSFVRFITTVQKLDTPLVQSKTYRPWVLTCPKTVTFREVIRTLVVNDSYRQYIVEAGIPVGVITLTDALAEIGKI